MNFRKFVPEEEAAGVELTAVEIGTLLCGSGISQQGRCGISLKGERGDENEPKGQANRVRKVRARSRVCHSFMVGVHPPPLHAVQPPSSYISYLLEPHPCDDGVPKHVEVLVRVCQHQIHVAAPSLLE